MTFTHCDRELNTYRELNTVGMVILFTLGSLVLYSLENLQHRVLTGVVYQVQESFVNSTEYSLVLFMGTVLLFTYCRGVHPREIAAQCCV